MAKKRKATSYWPHMILGFLIIGITLSYWTVKSASSVPVQESDTFLMKYQQADIHINEIRAKKARFDKQYEIKLLDVPMAVLELENTKRAKDEKVVVLKKGANSFRYRLVSRSGASLPNAHVTFLLTRPHTNKDDVMVEDVPHTDSEYLVKDVQVSKPGRYTLQLKVAVDNNTVGYSQIPAYLNPQ